MMIYTFSVKERKVNYTHTIFARQFFFSEWTIQWCVCTFLSVSFYLPTTHLSFFSLFLCLLMMMMEGGHADMPHHTSPTLHTFSHWKGRWRKPGGNSFYAILQAVVSIHGILIYSLCLPTTFLFVSSNVWALPFPFPSAIMMLNDDDNEEKEVSYCVMSGDKKRMEEGRTRMCFCAFYNLLEIDWTSSSMHLHMHSIISKSGVFLHSLPMVSLFSLLCSCPAAYILMGFLFHILCTQMPVSSRLFFSYLYFLCALHYPHVLLYFCWWWIF